jgi:hypothetical protein
MRRVWPAPVAARPRALEIAQGVTMGALAPERMPPYIRAMQRQFAIIATTTPSSSRGLFGARIFD